MEAISISTKSPTSPQEAVPIHFHLHTFDEFFLSGHWFPSVTFGLVEVKSLDIADAKM